MIGSLGNISFVASAEVQRTFRNLTKKYSARYAKHDLIGRKPKLEFIGADTRKFSLDIRLDATKGISPKEEIKAFAEMTENGTAEPLIIGGEYFGIFVLNSINEVAKIHDNAGRLWLAEITLDLEEYVDESV